MPADLQSAYWTLPQETHPQHVAAPFLSPSFCFDDARLAACPLAVHISAVAARRSVMHWLNPTLQYRTAYPSATVILIGSDMCEHPLGSGHSESGSDCCRVFGESRSDTL